MALSLLAKPSPTRALLIARLHHASPAAMRVASLSAGPLELSKSLSLPQVIEFSSPQRAPFCRHSWISRSGGSNQRCFCSSSGPMNGPGQGSVGNAGPTNTSYNQPYQQQQATYAAGNNPTYAQQQQPTYPSGKNTSNPHQQQQPTYAPVSQDARQSGHASPTGTPPAGMYGNQGPRQPGYAPPTGSPPGATYVPGNQGPQHPGNTPPTTVSSPAAGSPPPPRTSAAAEVIDKYLGPSTLKLDKRDDKAPPPPPPPRRNYGPQGTQEKKSGKDLVAESAACAVIEKYLGPWPGFPPRDPKIDEYLDSLPENAACAAIDKYFGPYKPLFVFKKNEENANNPPPPSRPPRNRMMSRARNRAWNSSQQGASVDRPWTAPHHGSNADATQGGQSPQSSGAPPLQGAGPTPSSTQGFGAVPSQQGTSSGMPPHPGTMPTQPGAMPSQQGGTVPPPHGVNMAPPHGAGFSPPGSNS